MWRVCPLCGESSELVDVPTGITCLPCLRLVFEWKDGALVPVLDNQQTESNRKRKKETCKPSKKPVRSIT